MAYDPEKTFTTVNTQTVGTTTTTTTTQTGLRLLHGEFGPKFQTGFHGAKLYAVLKGGFLNFSVSNAGIATGLGNAFSHFADGDTNGVFYPGVYLGMTKLRHAQRGRRALLVISDGGDNRSRYTERELKKLVEEADVEIYGIGIFERLLKVLAPPEERDGKRLLTSVSEASGGRLITLHSPRELPEIAAQVSLELHNRYLLGYRPASQVKDGKWHAIQVSLAAPLGRRLHVHAKKGYTAAGP